MDGETDSTETSLRYLGYLGRLRNLRHLAYTSDVGEAMRPVLPSWIVNAGYAVSIGYCGIDVLHEGFQSHKHKDTNYDTIQIVCRRTVFQGLASLVLPAVTIHSAVDFTSRLLKTRVSKSSFAGRFAPSVVGLAIVPFLPAMLDHPVEYIVDRSFDSIVGKLSPSTATRLASHH